MITESKKVAYHESGHALIYHLLGNRITYVEINEFGLGSCRISSGYKPSHYTTSDKSEHETNMLHWGLRCLSGYASECKMAGKDFSIRQLYEDYYLEESYEPENDMGSLIDEINKVNAMIGEEYFGIDFVCSAYQRAIEILHQPKCWRAVEKLSGELMQSEDGIVMGIRVHDVLGEFELDMLES